MKALSLKRIGHLLIGICFNLLLLAQNSQIIAGISGDNLIFYSLNTQETKLVSLSNSIISNQGGRSMIFNSSECAFYIITSASSQPKLHRITLDGEVTFAGNISYANGDAFYRCDALGYNPITNKTYISASNGPNNYTKILAEINLKNASCTKVTEIDNGSKEASDADYLAFYNGNLLIGDIYSSTIYSSIYTLDLAKAKGISSTTKLFETNTNFQFTDMAVVGDSIFAFYNGKIYSASINNAQVNFNNGRSSAISGITQLPIAITSFPYHEFLKSTSILNDTILCKNDSILVNAANYTNFVWNDGVRKNPRWIKNEGTYFGTVQKAGCSFETEPFTITKIWCNKCDEYYDEIKDKLSLGNDIVLCTNDIVQWQKSNLKLDSILWYDGDISFDKTINTASTVFASYYRDTCTFYSDTVNVKITDCLDCEVQFPTAFTPNKDNLNDVFQPIHDDGCSLITEQFVIYNRWGQIIYEDSQSAWNGTINETLAPTGIYIYKATLFNTRLQKRIALKGTIQVHY